MGTAPAPHGWRHSSRCGTDSRVEFARGDGYVLLRESREPDVVLMFGAADWAAFLAGARAGEFDAA